jgi:hypothetical protein
MDCFVAFAPRNDEKCIVEREKGAEIVRRVRPAAGAWSLGLLAPFAHVNVDVEIDFADAALF